MSFRVDADTGGLSFAHELPTAPYKPCNVASFEQCSPSGGGAA